MTPARLSVVDDMFYRGHHGRGVEVVMQGMWRFDDRLEPAELGDFHTLLAASPLTRRVVSPRIPWARRYFVDGAVVAPLRFDPTPIDADGVLAWSDEHAEARLDVDTGPAWDLALAHVDGGGSVVSLICSHLVSDGLGLVSEADTASGGPARPAPRRQRPVTSRPPRRSDDVADAVWLWVHVITGILRSLLRGCVDPQVRAELFGALRPAPSRPATPTTTTGRQSTAVVDVDAAEWDRYVAETGATSTAVVAALAADIVGELRGPGPVDTVVPMADGSGQALTVAEVAVDTGADPGVCAADLRAAYARAGSGRGLGPPGGMPAELLQLLGDRLAHAVVPDPGGRDALVSPLGDLGTGFDELAGHRSRGLAVRSAYPRSAAPGAARSSTLLGVWSARNCGRVVLSLVARTDPGGRSPADLARSALAHRGLTATVW
ncbi:hypothetical protein [Williamsia phyllosphaerae]|uniref:Diacylglycerol O-acyltransferase n=1 Tax=Williamsia phyllosphaerae TaxID=885042 RepID=A0ABQ1V3G0_9NOCA|nr:hypothetical protein [Williamsia phyllosphaerae]GGF34724.1 hypothetical protein GCM10007298_33150 [Williamsia phyllosphaerae]